jgi:dolichol-phosphate mannosyltransferase
VKLPESPGRKEATMIRYSVIIPQQDRGDEVRRQLPALAVALDRLGEPYEIIVVDDASTLATLRLVEKLLSEFHGLRLLRLNEPGGVSVALTAGIRAARGEVLIAVEPGENYPPEQIAQLVDGLQRADLMVGRRRQVGVAKAWHRISRLPRWLLLGLEGHDPDCLFWAGRREAFADINLTAGLARYLPALVMRRGFRVCETYVEHDGTKRPLQDVRANPGDLLAAWWHCRRWRNASAYEMTAGRTAVPLLRVVGAQEVSPHPGSLPKGEGAMVAPQPAQQMAAESIHYPSSAKRA